MLSGIITALLLALFVGGCIWAWSPKHKRAFDQAARIPLQETETAIDTELAGIRRNRTETPR
ncbi:MAG: cbb3-type cytochrome c oxidase subunit 3 [Pseudomonadota bacterium]